MKSKEILLKHLALNDCEGYVSSDGRLYKAIIDALDEASTIPKVSNHVVCDDWIHQERIKNNDDNYCPICGKQLQSK